jgi:hypothetical protein
MNKFYILYFLIIITFTFCKKEETKTTAPTIKKHVLSQMIKDFNFKTNSKWILKNTTNNNYDTIYVWASSPVETSYAYASVHSNETFEQYYTGITHTLLPAAWADISYLGKESGILAMDNWGAIEMGLGFFEKNIGDSITYSNSTSWNKIENIYPSLTVNGNTYNNVYEISYHPCWYGFSKIWWCPRIGFVKLEATNTTTNQFGSWELASYNVSLY